MKSGKRMKVKSMQMRHMRKQKIRLGKMKENRFQTKVLQRMMRFMRHMQQWTRCGSPTEIRGRNSKTCRRAEGSLEESSR